MLTLEPDPVHGRASVQAILADLPGADMADVELRISDDTLRG
jgi:HSP20 family molecular chaperone IbpA